MISKKPVIRAEGLSKTYRLYKRPHQRVLDVLGLLRKKEDSYTEHAAVHDVNLEIFRGERVAIIGRNGAGKSTLLKLITNVVHPTSGTIEVGGKLHALLSLGTGFHPEFTGRENVYAFLATAGITGSRADDLFQGIADFAEIDEYLDQPLKTYSTGMGVRLMFSTSTAIEPEILVLDEVLGVGDAYFVNKSLERIKELCDRDGTTLLLVTHDVYSALAYCDRMIWIDQGRVFQDGPSETVVKAYEASIRLQEEERLRLKSQRRARAETSTQQPVTFFQLVPDNRMAIRQKLTVGRIAVTTGTTNLDAIDPKTGAGSRESTRLLTESGTGNWGQPYQDKANWCRDLLPYGSIFQRGPFVFALTEEELDDSALTIELELRSPLEDRHFLEGYAPDGRSISMELDPQPAGQIVIALPFAKEPKLGRRQALGLESQQDIASSGDRFGNKRVQIQSVRLLAEDGTERRLYRPLEKVAIELIVDVLDPKLSGPLTALIAFQREGVRVTTRMIHEELELPPGAGRQVIRAELDPLLIGPGEYGATVGLYEGAYFSHNSGKHFATSSQVIDVIRQALHFEVQDNSLHYSRVDYAQPCRWTVGLGEANDAPRQA